MKNLTLLRSKLSKELNKLVDSYNSCTDLKRSFKIIAQIRTKSTELQNVIYTITVNNERGE